MKLKLNRYDIILIIICLILSISLFIYNRINSFDNSNNKQALVYYQNNLVYTFNLNDNKQAFYEVNATNGKVKIEMNNHKIRVVEENSLRHLCSIQGYTSSTINPIICLPNDLYIKIVGNDDNEVDVFIK